MCGLRKTSKGILTHDIQDRTTKPIIVRRMEYVPDRSEVDIEAIQVFWRDILCAAKTS